MIMYYSQPTLVILGHPNLEWPANNKHIGRPCGCFIEDSTKTKSNYKTNLFRNKERKIKKM